MSYGITMLAVVPVRKSPEENSEMVTQLLFGETFKILRQRNRYWTLIECAYDGYRGWVSQNQITPVSEADLEDYRHHHAVAGELYCPAMADGDSRYIPFGASLPQFDEMSFGILGKRYSYGGQVIFPERLINKSDYIEKMARKFLHTPYLWGGRSSFGIDCSGFVQVVFKALGITLPRDASQQVERGEIVDFASQARIGDLLFCRSHYKNSVSHVGMVLGKKKVIHASGKVRIDTFDHYGIFNHDENRYSHLMVVIKRVLPEQSV